ncbi:MAG TPA: hypothetical protein VHA05_02165 [Candidatus Saccharimonadales bacterium]|nr:hypothetical protein [Candidatus Saccharimonadales bacterium]
MKKIYTLVALGLIAIGILSWLTNYLSSGTISITTNSKSNTITLRQTNSKEPYVKTSMGSLSANVKHGRYVAVVKNGSRTSTQIINFRSGHKNFHYSMSVPDLLSVRVVSPQNAQSIVADDNKLVYLDTPSEILFKIIGQGSPAALGPTQQFQAVRWANASFGVGQDDNGYLYTITDGSASALKVPFPYNGNHVNFDVSPDKKIYVSYGPDVYAGDRNGNFKKIYTASSSNPALAAGTNGVAVSDSKYGKNPSNISRSLLATLILSGEKYKVHKENVEAERALWSPNGQYLVTVNQANPIIYDSSLDKTIVLPTDAVVGQIAWLKDTELIYTLNNQIWAYDLSSQSNRLLANVSSLESITGIYPSRNDRLYVTTFDTVSGNYYIKQVSLAG